MSPEILQIVRLAIELGLVICGVVFGAKFKKWKGIAKKIIDIIQDELSEREKKKVEKGMLKKGLGRFIVENRKSTTDS